MIFLTEIPEGGSDRMKQTSDKSEQAIRQLSDKLSEIITEAHCTFV